MSAAGGALKGAYLAAIDGARVWGLSIREALLRLQTTPRPRALTFFLPAPGDPQFLHDTGAVAVRVFPGVGFAWVLNRLRVSDLALSLEEKLRRGRELVQAFKVEAGTVGALLAAFDQHTSDAHDSFEDNGPLLVAEVLAFADRPAAAAGWM